MMAAEKNVGNVTMAKFGLSQPMRRVEDPRLLKGAGRYTDDISVPGQLHGILLRSPHAHARISTIDTADARALPGVHAVLTGQDWLDEGLGEIPCAIPLKNRDGSPRANTPRYGLAVGRVRHVGDPVAFIVADTVQAARDAAEAVMVDYDVLPSTTDLDALRQQALPLLQQDEQALPEPTPQVVLVSLKPGATMMVAFRAYTLPGQEDAMRNRLMEKLQQLFAVQEVK